MSFSNLKRNRNSISDLVAAANPESKSDKSSYVDDRLWKPTVDKAGNGYAVIRFLPGKDGDVPFVRYWDHGFKGPTGQWYIEKSLTSIGQQDPVSEMNSELWATETDDNRALVRERKRRLHYIANILVESDPSNPQNEGKVFLYVFGKKIFDKIMDKMQPQFADEDPINPFDFWDGASFKLKIRQVEGYRNYDKSEFSTPSPLMDGDDEKLEVIYNQLYNVNEFIDPANYKTYDELKARLDMVLGLTARRTVQQEHDLAQVREPAPMRSTPPLEATSVSASSEDEEDTMSYFARLASEE
jgi:hypothetical protein